VISGNTEKDVDLGAVGATALAGGTRHATTAGMDELRTCPNCDTPVGDTDTVCPNCGESLVGG
jgi:hypothetical protein